MSQPILCPKCGAKLATLIMLGATGHAEIRSARCAGCGFCSGWLRIPAPCVPHIYLRERLARVERAYRMVWGLEGVHG